MKITIDAKGLNLYRLIPLALILWPAANAVADYALGTATGTFTPVSASAVASEPVEEDDTLTSASGETFTVTSGYDLQRVHPVHQDIRPHYGVDVDTPVGTPLIAPAVVEVSCWWDNGGGGLVADITPQSKADGDPVRALHLSYCIKGAHPVGSEFALTGDTGEGTGAHLDLRRVDKEPPRRKDVEPYLTGQLPAPAPVEEQPTLEDLLAGLDTDSIKDGELTDKELICAIGAAEGTRNHDCSESAAYDGHTDPGNGAANLGSFSYQHGASTPEEADRLQITRLRRAEDTIDAQARAKFGRSLSKPAMGAALDLWNQSPAAGESFVDNLPNAEPSAEEIVTARSASYVSPATGRLDAPGLGNDPSRVQADQARRTGEVIYQLERAQTDEEPPVEFSPITPVTEAAEAITETLQQRRLDQLDNN